MSAVYFITVLLRILLYELCILLSFLLKQAISSLKSFRRCRGYEPIETGSQPTCRPWSRPTQIPMRSTSASSQGTDHNRSGKGWDDSEYPDWRIKIGKGRPAPFLYRLIDVENGRDKIPPRPDHPWFSERISGLGSPRARIYVAKHQDRSSQNQPADRFFSPGRRH